MKTKQSQNTKTLTGTYVWSAFVEVRVPKNATLEQQREALDNAAQDAANDLDFKHPVLHECSNPKLID